MPKITNCLWFDREAEAAAELYVSLFPNSRILSVGRYPEGLPGDRAGEVMIVEFELDGRAFSGLNGGPQFTFDEAVSFQIEVQDQAELDHYWDGLIAGGGSESQCGWLKDRFGVSWQVVPVQLVRIMSGPDKAAAGRMTGAMMQMTRLDIAELEAAAAG